MNAPEVKPREYVAYPAPKFHTTIHEPTQVPPVFNKKDWSRPSPKTPNPKK